MPWYPGQNAQGQKVFGDIVGLARGVWTQPPAITTPGTVASPGTVTNSTGYDVIVYGSATAVTAVKLNNVTLPGTFAAGQMFDFYLPAGQTIALTYTGTLAWSWLAV